MELLLKLDDLRNIPDWCHKDKIQKSLAYDYMQKISYAFQDWNKTIEEDLSVKNLCYLILQAVWIQEAVMGLKKMYRKDICNRYVPLDLSTYDKYLRAIRSFTLAHPMSTDRHSTFGFDGSVKCVDIRIGIGIVDKLLTTNERYKYIDLNGIHDGRNDHYKDYCLYVYSDNDSWKFFYHIFCSLKDLRDSAQAYIDEYLNFCKFLSKQRKKYYI